MTQVDIAALSPQVVWQHFQTLCTIPRPSKHEQQLREFLQNWAESRNLETYVDEVGNLIIRKMRLWVKNMCLELFFRAI